MSLMTTPIEKKEDARILRTRNELRQGLLRLLKERPFEKITVKEICLESGINKMTFYKHYDDKYDLLDDCVKTISHQIYVDVVNEKADEACEDSREVVAHFAIRIIDHCLAHKDSILSISQCPSSLGTEVFKNAMQQIISGYIQEMATHMRFRYDTGDIAAFLSGGFSTLLMRVVHEGDYNRDRYFQFVVSLFDAAYMAIII